MAWVCDPVKYHLSAQYSPGYPSSLPFISLTDPVPRKAEFVPRSGVTILSASETSGLMGAVDHSFAHSAGPSATVHPGALRTGRAWHSQYSYVGSFDPWVSSPSCFESNDALQGHGSLPLRETSHAWGRAQREATAQGVQPSFEEGENTWEGHWPCMQTTWIPFLAPHPVPLAYQERS